MNQTWLGIDPGLAIVGWAFLEEVRTQDAKLLAVLKQFYGLK